MSTAQAEIHKLAQDHNISHQHSPLDRWADNISRLSDAEVELDETQWLLIELSRAKIITGQDRVALGMRYFDERKSGGNVLEIETADEIEISASDS
jgi:hypothetical protein